MKLKYCRHSKFRKIYSFIVSFLSLGILSAFCWTAFYFLIAKLTDFSSFISVVMFSLSIIFTFFLVFICIISFTHKHSLLITLFVLLIIFGGIHIFCGISFSFLNRFLSYCFNVLWKSKHFKGISKYFETRYKCCGFSNRDSCPQGSKSCVTVFEDFRVRWLPFGFFMIILGMADFIATIFVLFDIVKPVRVRPDHNEEHQDESKPESNPESNPESKPESKPDANPEAKTQGQPENNGENKEATHPLDQSPKDAVLPEKDFYYSYYSDSLSN